MASSYLQRTTTSTGSNYTATLSAWVKRAKTGVRHCIFAGWESSTERMVCDFTSGDKLAMQIFTGGTAHDIESNRSFRDIHAWYHVVFQFNTSSGTEADRFKMFVNGEQITSFATDDNISQNIQMKMWGSTSQETIVGCRKNSGYEHFYDGIISHVHIIDGTVYAPTEFGETDATTGAWKWKNPSGLNYGTNGTFLLKDGAVTTDSSSNSNNYTTGGTVTSTEDCPNNNFCTLSSLGVEKWTMINGSLEISGASDNQMMIGSMHSDAGYYECKIAAPNGGTGKGIRLGLVKADGGHALTYSGISGNSGDLERFIGIQNTAGGYKAVYNNGYTVTDFGGTSNANDVMQVAWKGGKVWYGVNGTWLGSGDPSAGTNHADTLTTGMTYLPAVISSLDGADGAKLNFGNGYFGTTAISSEGTNASGIGKFEYDVPTGCTAVSTKGLNE